MNKRVNLINARKRAGLTQSQLGVSGHRKGGGKDEADSSTNAR